MFLFQLIGVAYISVMIYFAIGMRKALKNNQFNKVTQLPLDFTVVIPFRNEESTLPTLVHSLKMLDKPSHSKVKFIFVDDHSEDNSKSKLDLELNGFPFEYEVLQNDGEGKKRALQTGINHVQTKWIVTTDADVECPKTWLTAIAQKIGSTQSEMLVMPIELKSQNSFFEDIQKLESSALVSMSMGSLANGVVFSANGANLAFTKNIFMRVGAYTPEMQLASGDDEFLLKRVHNLNPDLVEVFMTHDVLIKTDACQSLTHLISQRTRWISKVKTAKFSWNQLPVIIPSLFMLFLIVSIPLALFFPFNWIKSGLLLDKWIGDVILFSSFASFFKYSFKKNIRLLGLIAVMPFYQVIYMIPVLYQKFFGEFTWKGRTYEA